MECLQASEIVSSVLDGEPVDAARLAEARIHCASCPQCASLLKVLERVRFFPGPKAPETLVAQLEAAAIKAAADARATTQIEDFPPRHPTVERKRAWQITPRLAALGSAAAVLLVVFAAGTIALVGLGAQKAADEGLTVMEEEYSTAPSAAPEAGVAEDATTMRAQTEPAPPYVVFDRTVYVQSNEVIPSTLTTAGSVVSDVGSGTPASRTAFVVPGNEDLLFVQVGPGQLLSFSRVVRSLGRAEYALVSDVPISRFGEWPGLPSGMQQPESADGAPVFRRIGFDDSGVDVYGPLTTSINDAFAIAPGTAETDPAGGNPYWTWWERVR